MSGQGDPTEVGEERSGDPGAWQAATLNRPKGVWFSQGPDGGSTGGQQGTSSQTSSRPAIAQEHVPGRLAVFETTEDGSDPRVASLELDVAVRDIEIASLDGQLQEVRADAVMAMSRLWGHFNGNEFSRNPCNELSGAKGAGTLGALKDAEAALAQANDGVAQMHRWLELAQRLPHAPTQKAPVTSKLETPVQRGERRLREIFDRCDLNGSSTINKRELIKLCRQQSDVADFFELPQHIHQEDGSRDAFERIFQGIDVDGDREISWDEFHRFYAHRRSVVVSPSDILVLSGAPLPSTPSAPSRSSMPAVLEETCVSCSSCGNSSASRSRKPSDATHAEMGRKLADLNVKVAKTRDIEVLNADLLRNVQALESRLQHSEAQRRLLQLRLNKERKFRNQDGASGNCATHSSFVGSGEFEVSSQQQSFENCDVRCEKARRRTGSIPEMARSLAVGSLATLASNCMGFKGTSKGPMQVGEVCRVDEKEEGISLIRGWWYDDHAVKLAGRSGQAEPFQHSSSSPGRSLQWATSPASLRGDSPGSKAITLSTGTSVGPPASWDAPSVVVAQTSAAVPLALPTELLADLSGSLRRLEGATVDFDAGPFPSQTAGEVSSGKDMERRVNEVRWLCASTWHSTAVRDIQIGVEVRSTGDNYMHLGTDPRPFRLGLVGDVLFCAYAQDAWAPLEMVFLSLALEGTMASLPSPLSAPSAFLFPEASLSAPASPVFAASLPGSGFAQTPLEGGSQVGGAHTPIRRSVKFADLAAEAAQVSDISNQSAGRVAEVLVSQATAHAAPQVMTSAAGAWETPSKLGGPLRFSQGGESVSTEASLAGSSIGRSPRGNTTPRFRVASGGVSPSQMHGGGRASAGRQRSPPQSPRSGGASSVNLRAEAFSPINVDITGNSRSDSPKMRVQLAFASAGRSLSPMRLPIPVALSPPVPLVSTRSSFPRGASGPVALTGELLHLQRSRIPASIVLMPPTRRAKPIGVEVNVGGACASTAIVGSAVGSLQESSVLLVHPPSSSSVGRPSSPQHTGVSGAATPRSPRCSVPGSPVCAVGNVAPPGWSPCMSSYSGAPPAVAATISSSVTSPCWSPLPPGAPTTSVVFPPFSLTPHSVSAGRTGGVSSSVNAAGEARTIEWQCSSAKFSKDRAKSGASSLPSAEKPKAAMRSLVKPVEDITIAALGHAAPNTTDSGFTCAPIQMSPASSESSDVQVGCC